MTLNYRHNGLGKNTFYGCQAGYQNLRGNFYKKSYTKIIKKKVIKKIERKYNKIYKIYLK